MALNKNVKVPMPEHGAVKRRMGDKVYVYYATAVYRNEKGQHIFLKFSKDLEICIEMCYN